jgi:hypothetical protein
MTLCPEKREEKRGIGASSPDRDTLETRSGMVPEKGFCSLEQVIQTGADMLFYQLDRAFYPHGPVIPEFRKNRQINELLRFFVRASA